jgi:Permuted papain-like amidase enzyme, YaeF/YiiX, C92 family
MGRLLGTYLSQPVKQYKPLATSSPAALAAALRPGDVLLVEGNTRVSAAIKYLSQSTWSHAAIYIGDALKSPENESDPPVLVEADMIDGVCAIPLSKYASFHTRICRPVELTEQDTKRVVDYILSRIGHTYDMKNMFDLARYLFPTPPLPRKWRRRALAMGSGEPSKAICSSLIAQAFQAVRYPILPDIKRRKTDPHAKDHNREILYIRHYSLYMPRDFDISPYFQVVKPAIENGFNYKGLTWEDTPGAEQHEPAEVPFHAPAPAFAREGAQNESAAPVGFEPQT